MQREMETTRTELRKGILELPQETADSAAQMRRVIVEQIDALAELNRIVARHGGAPRSSSSRRGAPSRWRQAAARAPRPARRHANANPTAAAAPIRRPRGVPDAATPPAAGGRPRRRLADGPAGTGLARRAGRGRARTTGRRATRWSRSTSLSVDIARMIDHDAAAELWERYKRGERNVFTRRLYTLAGAEDVRGDPQALSRPTASSSRRSTAISGSSSGC